MPEPTEGKGTLESARDRMAQATALRLLPAPQAELPLASVYADEAAHSSAGELPYTVINMVASLDGKAATGGKASSLGSPADRVIMDNLRAGADAVLIGAGTLRAEKLTLGVSPQSQHRRLARGLAPQPLAVIIAGSSDPRPALAQNLLHANTHNTLLIVPGYGGAAWVDSLGTRVEWEGGGATVVRLAAGERSGVDLREALLVLRGRYGVGRLLVEGGPAINGAMISASLVHEVFLTIAPKIVGDMVDQAGERPGEAPPSVVRGLTFAPEGPGPLDLTLRSVHARGGELFLRYGVG